MASSNIPAVSQPRDVPKIDLFTMVRLGTFNMGLSIMSLLLLGVLNRVLIADLKVPALVAAGVISVYQFMAPARVWFGQRSDVKPIFGHYRSGYIWLGIVGMAIAGFLVVQVMWQLGTHIEQFGWGPGAYPWVGLMGVMFALYGLALAATTPFTALLVDVSDENTKSKIVGIGWSMLMVGIVVGVIIVSIVTGSLGETPSIAELRGPINRLFVIAPAIVCAITIVSTTGIEKRFSQRSQRSAASDREDSITLSQALKVLTASRQTGLFFGFLLVLILSLFTQNAVLEPYGNEVFGMSVKATTGLNAFFGIGTLIGIMTTGFVLMPLLGKKRTVKVGCFAAAVFLLALIGAGAVGQPWALQGAVGLFGLAAGVLTTGSTVLMIDLTAAETAGTFIGAWGLAQAVAQGIASVLGGGLLSLGKTITGASVTEVASNAQLVPAYGLVFFAQAVGMLVAITLVSNVNITEFQLDAKQAITAALESDMD
ncbi:MAG: BCD family MFS transporter [Cyanobacteria bacterium P01_A01_bin.116]